MDSGDSASETISSDRKCMMVTKESVFFAPTEAMCPNISQDTPYCHTHQYSQCHNTVVRKKLVHVEATAAASLKLPSSVVKMIVILVLLTITAILTARNNGNFQLNFVFCCLGLVIGLLSGSLVSGASECNACKQN